MSRLWRFAALSLVGLPLFPIAADATIPIASVTSTILSQSTYVYATIGNGDVVFQLSNPNNGVAGCDGFWLRATDPGFKNSLAVLLAVIQSQAPITVWTDNTQIWTGSTQHYCLVYNLQI